MTLDEAFSFLYESKSEKPKLYIVTAYIATNLTERLLAGSLEDRLDEQALIDWYNFAANVENIVKHLGNVQHISLSKYPNSLSEYIDFYIIDENNKQKEYILNLRLSDHIETANGRQVRLHKVNELDDDSELIDIVVNDGSKFKTYHQAIQYLRKTLAEYMFDQYN